MKILLPILAFVVLALIARWWYVNNLTTAAPKPETELPRLKTLGLNDHGNMVLSGYDHFVFDRDATTPLLNANNETFLDKVTLHLVQNPDLLLNITGCFGSDEMVATNGIFENIGLGRANVVRNLLVERGIAFERITLSFNTGTPELRKQPIAFNLYLSAQGVDFVPLTYTFEDMTFSDESFAPKGVEFRPILPLVQYADSVRKYLALHKDKKLNIIGHTDNATDAKTSLALGKTRAQNVMRYFRELGIPLDQMAAFTDGSRHPVSSNDTEVGRRRNRRINFIIE